MNWEVRVNYPMQRTRDGHLLCEPEARHPTAVRRQAPVLCFLGPSATQCCRVAIASLLFGPKRSTLAENRRFSWLFSRRGSGGIFRPCSLTAGNGDVGVENNTFHIQQPQSFQRLLGLKKLHCNIGRP